ncbi:hypothetical protein GCM10009602_21500 [Nocardiopsis tropica]
MRNPLRKARSLTAKWAPPARRRPAARTPLARGRNPLAPGRNPLAGGGGPLGRPGRPVRTPGPVNPLRFPAGRTPPRGRRPRRSPLSWLSGLARSRRIR